MSRVKQTIRVLLVAVAASMTISASASAYEYLIEGTPLTSSEAIEGMSNEFVLESTIGKTPIALRCSEGTSTGVIKNEGLSTHEDKLKNCYVFTKTKTGAKEFLTACKIAEPITIKVGGELSVNHVVDLFPEEMANLELNGETCALKGKYELLAERNCAIYGAEFSKVIHTDVCTPAGDESGLNVEEAFITNTWQTKTTKGQRMAVGGPPPPVIRATRKKGRGAPRTKLCLFNETGVKCVIRVEMTANTTGETLVITKETLKRFGGGANNEYQFVIPATELEGENECNIGRKLKNNEPACALEVKYGGPAMPAVDAFISLYEAQAEEEGGAKRKTPITRMVLGTG